MRDEYGVKRQPEGAPEAICGLVCFVLSVPFLFACATGFEGFGLSRDTSVFLAVIPMMAVFFCLSYVGTKITEWYRIRYRGWSR